MKDLIKKLREADTGRFPWLSLCHEAADAIEQLLSQLPEGMKHCTIVFKECPIGHGWLTATNWVEHGCQRCKILELEQNNIDWAKGNLQNTREKIRLETALLTEIHDLRVERDALEKLLKAALKDLSR